MSSVVIQFPKKGNVASQFEDMVTRYESGEYVGLFVVASTKDGGIERIEINQPFAGLVANSSR